MAYFSGPFIKRKVILKKKVEKVGQAETARLARNRAKFLLTPLEGEEKALSPIKMASKGVSSSPSVATMRALAI